MHNQPSSTLSALIDGPLRGQDLILISDEHSELLMDINLAGSAAGAAYDGNPEIQNKDDMRVWYGWSVVAQLRV